MRSDDNGFGRSMDGWSHLPLSILPSYLRSDR